MALKCPFCDFKSERLLSMIVHVRKKHRNEKRCPVCGYEFKDLLKHLAQNARGDRRHRYVYVLFSRGSKSYFSRKIRKELTIEGVVDA